MQADVAQLVERNLAKVEVASSSLVVRSERVSADPSKNGGLAERRGNGLQIRIHGFKSRTHLETPLRAIGAVVARFPDTEEVTGSNPVSPTSNNRRSEAGFRKLRSASCHGCARELRRSVEDARALVHGDVNTERP